MVTEDTKMFLIYFVLALSTTVVIGLFFLYTEILELEKDVDNAQKISMKNQDLMREILRTKT